MEDMQTQQLAARGFIRSRSLAAYRRLFVINLLLTTGRLLCLYFHSNPCKRQDILTATYIEYPGHLLQKLLKSKESKKVKWCIYVAPLSHTSQRCFTMINLPTADWKHIQAQIAAASKQSMHAGTHFTDLGRMES